MAGRAWIGDLRQIVAGLVASGAGSTGLLAYRSSLVGKHNLNPFQTWLASADTAFIIAGCLAIGLTVYWILHTLSSPEKLGSDPTRNAEATASGKSQSASTTGDNSPIYQHMGPEEPPQRNLTIQQSSVLKAALSKAPPTTIIVYRLESKESQKYVIQFAEVLKESGWEVQDLIGISQPFPEEKIRIAWRGKKTPGYLAFVAGMTNAGIIFTEDEVVSDSDPRIKVIFDVGRAKMDDFQAAADRLHF